MKLGIIGATGWLGSALGRRVMETGLLQPEDLVLLNRSGPRPSYEGRTGVIWAADVAELAARSDVIVLSVRPQDWAALRLRAEGRLVLSFMAGIGMARLAACGGRVVRAMPNAAAEFGGSYSPWFAAADVTEPDRQRVAALLACIGTSDELQDEAHLDLMTAVPGSGAAYPALLAQAMLTFMRDRGVPEAIAQKAVAAAVCGGARLLEGRIAEAQTFLDLYIGYEGTTAAGLRAAQAAGFDQAIQQALQAATITARKLGE